MCWLSAVPRGQGEEEERSSVRRKSVGLSSSKTDLTKHNGPRTWKKSKTRGLVTLFRRCISFGVPEVLKYSSTEPQLVWFCACLLNRHLAYRTDACTAGVHCAAMTYSPQVAMVLLRDSVGYWLLCCVRK